MKGKEAEVDSKTQHILCVGIQGRGMDFSLKRMILKNRNGNVKLMFINDIRNEYRKDVHNEHSKPF